jgi:hypothetical protein
MYRIEPEGFEQQTIEVKPLGIISGYKLLVNGVPAPRGPRRGEMSLSKDDGSEVIAGWRPRAMGLDFPNIAIGDQVIEVVEPLKWYEWLWSALPIPLLLTAGVFGALTGYIGFSVSTRIFRSEYQTIMKFLLSAVVSVIAIIGYFVLAVTIVGLLN